MPSEKANIIFPVLLQSDDQANCSDIREILTKSNLSLDSVTEDLSSEQAYNKQ